LAYGLKASVWLLPDQSHATKCSFNGMLHSVGLWDFWLLFLTTLNYEFGPRNDETRRSILRSLLAKLYDNRMPEDAPIFMELAPQMVFELESNNIAHFDRVLPLEIELWNWLKSNNRSGSMGRRIAMNRYGGSLHGAMRELPLWAVHLWERSCVAIETDVLKGKRFTDKLVCKAKHKEAEDVGVTGSRGIHIEDRALKSCCENATAVNVMILQQSDHRRIVQITCAYSRPVDKYHTTQNRECRSARESQLWLLEMTSGGYTKFLRSFLELLTDRSVLVDAGFKVDAIVADLPGDLSVPLLDELLIEENEYADLSGQMVLAYLTEFAVRGLWLSSWPARMTNQMKSHALAVKVIDEYKLDLEVFDAFCAFDGKTAAEKQVQSRHLFQLRCNEQYTMCFRQWCASEHVPEYSLPQIQKTSDSDGWCAGN
jgi:hypothetical protein